MRPSIFKRNRRLNDPEPSISFKDRHSDDENRKNNIIKMGDGKQCKLDNSFIKKVLQQAESDPDLDVISMDSTAACNVGDNFMSNVRRFTVLLKDSNNNCSKKFLLIKKLPASLVWREMFGCDLAFRNEASAYHIVIPGMKEFLDTENLSFPKCIHASAELTILEDLKPKGFVMADRRAGLDLEHAVLALKELGRFHGTSLAMKHSQPTRFKEMISSVQEIAFLPDKKEGFGTAIYNSIRMATLGLKVFRATGTECFEEAICKLQMIKNSAFDRLVQLTRPREPLSVISHGDFYVNNLMFKYDESSGDVCDVMFVDLQGVRYCSLAIDLLYFFCTSLRPGVVASHLHDMVQVYLDSLNQHVDRHAPSAPKVTMRQILDELESHSTYGLIMGLLVLPAVTALPGSMPDKENIESFSAQESFDMGLDMLSPGYFQRLHQLVSDFVELGYL